MADCQICGSIIKRPDRKYCCRACSNIGKIKEKPLCLMCGTPCKTMDRKYCSSLCRTNSMRGRKQTKEQIDKRVNNTDQKAKETKRKKTMLERYGEDNPSKVDMFAEKISESNKGRLNPRVEGQQENIIKSKRENGNLKHTDETRLKISQSLRKLYDDPDFDRSIFVRETPNGKNSKTGYYNGIYFRSSYEEMFLKFCEFFSVEVRSAANKEHCVKYDSIDGSTRSYYPDFYLPESNTTVEIKPISMYEVRENPGKFDAAMRQIENYVILSELDGLLYEDEWQEFYENQVKYW